MNLVIADPPNPRTAGTGGRKNRASRWYGTGQRSTKDRPADRHEGAAEWDDPARHRALLGQLCDVADGWAISTSPDGLAAYGDLPTGTRIGAWIKPNASPGSHRMRSIWEPVIIYPPAGRRSNRGGVGMVPDVLTDNAPRTGFPGAKPRSYTWWLLDCLSYSPAQDNVWDMFHGSGAVTRAIGEYAAERGCDVAASPDGITRPRTPLHA